jgi:hypothetical protein
MTYPITPNPAVHSGAGSKPTANAPVPAQQLQAWAQNLLNAIVAQVLSALTLGLVKPGDVVNGLLELEEWAASLFDPQTYQDLLNDLYHAFTGQPAGTIPAFPKTLGELVDAAGDVFQNALDGITGLIDHARLPVIPVSNIGSAFANLLVGGSFDSAVTLDPDGQFVWDSVGRDKPGSAKAVADGTTKVLHSNTINVTANQTFDFDGYVQWSGVTAGGGPAFQISVVPYLAGVTGTAVVLDSITSPGTSAGWQHLQGSYAVPSSGVDAIRVRISVTTNVTAGSVWFDDLEAVKTGLLSGGLVKGIVDTINDELQNTWNSLTGGLSGLNVLTGNATAVDVNGQLIATAEAIARNAAAVAALQTTANSNANSGNSAFVNFATRANSGSLGSDFSQTYSGSGTGTLGISGGMAAWQVVNNNERTCVAVYNAKETMTDYQRVGAAYASIPSKWFWTVPAYNYLYGRMNAAGTSYVYARLESGFAEIGCVVAGVKTVFASNAGFTFQSGMAYWLECGQTGGANIIKLLDSNGNALISYTDSAAVSQVGSGYRYTGFGGYAFANGLAHTEPGRVMAFSMSDNTPQPIIGSGFRRYRSSTSGVGMSDGANLIPGSFFDTADINTGEYTYDHSTNKITVTKAGWYGVSLSVKFDTYLNNGLAGIIITPLLYKNSFIAEWGTQSFGVAGGYGGSSSLSSTWIVYCNAGDYLQPGYDAEHDPASDMIGGGGSETYWKVSLLNWSLS